MSDSKRAAGGKLIVGKPVTMPEYRYQAAWGKSGSISASAPKTAERKFQVLSNFVPAKA